MIMKIKIKRRNNIEDNELKEKKGKKKIKFKK